MSSQDVLVEGSFVRSDDDSVVIKGMDAAIDTRGVVVRDNVLWNQVSWLRGGELLVGK